MRDKYNSFSELAKNETRDRDFRVRLREHPNTTGCHCTSPCGIEPGTSEVAEAISGDDVSFYAFDGIKAIGSGDLHITSVRFDEPQS